MKAVTSFAHFLVALIFSVSCRADDCSNEALLGDKGATAVRVNSNSIRKLSPQFFGFNLEIVEFQNSLWNSREQRVEPSVIEYLRRLPGAVYRYPGGTVANNFDWKSATGPTSSRPVQKIVDWQVASVVQFGPAEYLNFVREVSGTAWYVVNLQGSVSSSIQLEALASSASQLAIFMSNLQSKGMPRVFRWELGNELDRGRYRWPALRYVAASKEIADALRSNYEDAEIVGMTQDWEHTGASVAGVDYNTAVARDLKDNVSEFAGHAYYDGAPWGPVVPRVVRQLCKNLDAIRRGAPNSVMWVTEHGRTPLGTPKDPGWKFNWPQTGDLSAAISVADMMISLSRMPNIRGAFVHSLHGTSGPWPMFHKHVSGTVSPSAVYWAIVLLREDLLEDVLQINVRTSNNASNGVGYDANIAVLSNLERSRFSVWMTNRSSEGSVAKIYIPPLAGKKIVLKVAHLTGSDPTDSNYVNPYKVFPVRNKIVVDVSRTGEFSLTVPPYSVYVAGFEISAVQ
ncbi:Intracellular exo-alpha-(1-_5)-L-arabinofuranosidase [Azoarcus sp. Aa7]|nr:Intracellular exo-alpha-(1->5)-L-arabinofuranosidase [Azoarcus sp. Aa7]